MHPKFPSWSLLLLTILLHPSIVAANFACPPRCQCYADNEQPSQVHLLCKWEQINDTNLRLARPDLVRTLTIRCPYHSPKVSTPPPALFQGFRNLDRLELDRCLMEKVPESLFAGLAQLYSLIVKNAKITDFPRNIFAYVPNLMTLDISGNRLRIEPYSLKSLENLIYLDMSENEIGFLTNTLISLTKLRVVTLNNNKISNIDFRRFPENLTDLSIRHNLISTIHYLPGSVSHLKRLDLSGNLLEFLAASTSGGVNVLPGSLRHVDLSNNHLNYVQESAIAHLPNLVLLDLKNNSLREMRKSFLKGSTEGNMKVFLAENPLACHCNHKWIAHSSNKNISVADVDLVQCVDILKPDHLMPLMLAESRNQLLCKYANMCEADCKCCEDPECDCRFQCPPSCKCLRSADTSNPRTTQNVMVCENLRLDRIGKLPSPLTKLELNNTHWKGFQVEDLLGLPNLKYLKISNSKVSAQEIEKISQLQNLTHLEISYSSLDSIPNWITSLPNLSHFYIQSNPLKQLNFSDLSTFEKVKKIKLGGNNTNFACDCDSPTDIQRWLVKKTNRIKIEDLDDIYCDLNNYGIVSIVETLPGTNESVCVEPSEETKQWMTFVENAQKDLMERKKSTMLESTTTQLSIPSTKEFTISEVMKEFNHHSTETMKDRIDTTTLSIPTTSKYRKKYKDYDQEQPHKFVNVLIFILFICVIILIISIGVTVYFKFLHPDKFFMKLKSKRASQRTRKEEEPLRD